MPDKLGDNLRLNHILDAIHAIFRFVKDADYEAFMSNEMMISACVRQLEIIGEAANRLSDATVNMNSEIQWRKIIGLRNLLIHEYFVVDNDVVWSVIQEELHKLEFQVEELINNV